MTSQNGCQGISRAITLFVGQANRISAHSSPAALISTSERATFVTHRQPLRPVLSSSAPTRCLPVSRRQENRESRVLVPYPLATNRPDRSKRFSIFPVYSGLACDTVQTISRHKGKLWTVQLTWESFYSSRGHVSAGYGRIGKHRKHPGGRGMAGGQHHHRTNLDKYHPGYFGKVGMRYFHKTNQQFWKPTINLDKVRGIQFVYSRRIRLAETDGG